MCRNLNLVFNFGDFLKKMIEFTTKQNNLKNFTQGCSWFMYVFKFMTRFTSCFMMGKAHGWGDLHKMWGAKLGYDLMVGPLFWGCPHPRALPYT
jgi:hypothetical protein